MSGQQLNNPLHGIKLATMLEQLFLEYGWSIFRKKSSALR